MEAYDLAEIFQKGLSFHQAHRLNEAKHCYLQVLEHRPHHPDSLHLLGLIELEEGNIETAKRWLEKAIAINPNQAEFQNSLAQLLLKQSNYSEAIHLLEFALELNPAFVPAIYSLANLSEMLGHPKQALEYYERLLHFQPSHFQANNEYASLLAKFKEYAKARSIFEKLMKSFPHEAIIFNNLGTMLMEQGQYEEALQFFQKALSIQPGFTFALLNTAIVWVAQGQYENAISNLQQILPNEAKQNEFHWIHAKILSVLAIAYCHTCQWKALDKLKAQLPRLINKFDNPILEPLQALALELPDEVYKKTCQQWVAKNHFPSEHTKAPSLIESEQKIKVGYISPDFNHHPVGLLFHQFVEFHSDQFEVYAFSLKKHQDSIYQELQYKVDHFIELSSYSLSEKVKIISKFKLDILIDLAGYTENAEPALFSTRLARRQATWLGYPHSLHHPGIEYFLVPEIIMKQVHHYTFSEKLIGLNTWIGCKGFNDANSGIVTRKDYGLPESAFIFCCFHRHYRINQATFDCWLQILANTSETCLWLNSGSPTTNNHLCEVAQAYGVDPKRLVFSPPEKLTLQWRHQLADVWLDTFSFSAGTSAILSAWAGLPFLTLEGQTPQSLSATAIARILVMPELIAESQQQYIHKAIQWATHRDDFLKIKTQMQLAKHSQLFQPKQFINELEDKLIKIIND